MIIEVRKTQLSLIWPTEPFQLILMFNSLANFAYLAESTLTNLASVSALPPSGYWTALAKLSRKVGSASAFSISALRRATTSNGVPAGTKAPFQS
jgi:hypothetical protein